MQWQATLHHSPAQVLYKIYIQWPRRQTMIPRWCHSLLRRLSLFSPLFAVSAARVLQDNFLLRKTPKYRKLSCIQRSWLLYLIDIGWFLADRVKSWPTVFSTLTVILFFSHQFWRRIMALLMLSFAMFMSLFVEKMAISSAKARH